MFKSGLKHFSRLSSLVICFELCFAPLAFSQTNNKQETKWRKTANAVQDASTLLMGAVSAYTQAGQQNSGGSIEHFKAELSPALRMTPINPQEIPAVFQSCIVLPASGANLTGGYSCLGADPGKIDAGYATAIIDLAEQNRQDLLNFTTKGHSRYSTQGVGCYEKKLDDYKAIMAARQEELTAFTNSLKDRIENLTISLADGAGNRNVPIDEFLDLIKTDEALLTGTPERFIKDVKFEDYLLGQNDPVCSTFLSASDIQQAGRSGLRAIEEDVFSKVNNKSNGNMTADEMLTKADDIKNEVKTYGRELGKIAQRKDGLSLDVGDVTYSSRLSGTISASLKRVATQFNAKMTQELESIEQESDVNQAIAGNQKAQSILAGIKSGNTNYKERIKSFERITKTQCLRDSITRSFGSVQAFATSFRDPNISKRLSREADNSLANLIISQINTSEGDIEDITRSIANYENTGKNRKKVFRSNKTFEVDGKMYGGLPMRSSQLISVFKDNCIATFERTKNRDGFSGSNVIAKLTEYGNKYSALKSQAPNQIKTLLQDEIVNCPQDKTTGSEALSCSGALQASGANFCVRTAVACASNMNGCLEKSRSVVKQVKDKQASKVKFLKQATTNLKNNIKTELANLTKFYETQARKLDADLDIGTIFEMPEGMGFNLNADFSFKGEEGQGINSEFNLEDPKAMLAQAEEKVKLMKDALEKHNQLIGNKLEQIKDGYIDNYLDQKDYWEDIIADCDGRNRDHQQQKAEQEQARLKSDAEIARGCAEIRAFNNSANQCEDIGELGGTVMEIGMIAAQQSGNSSFGDDRSAMRTLSEVRRECGRTETRQAKSIEDPKFKDYLRYCKAKRGVSGCRSILDYGNKEICSESQFITKSIDTLEGLNKIERSGRKFKICNGETPNVCEGPALTIEDILYEKSELEALAVDNVDCRSEAFTRYSGDLKESMNKRRLEENVIVFLEDQPDNGNSDYGENSRQISVAACNAQGNGYSQKDQWSGLINTAIEQYRGAASVREASNTVPSGN